jgi:hypothetical protein
MEQLATRYYKTASELAQEEQDRIDALAMYYSVMPPPNMAIIKQDAAVIKGMAYELGAEVIYEAIQPNMDRFDFGYWLRVQLPNGWVASIICHVGSYGSEANLWEIAIIDTAGTIRRDTDFVLGHLTVDDVEAVLHKMTKLPSLRYWRKDTRL